MSMHYDKNIDWTGANKQDVQAGCRHSFKCDKNVLIPVS